MVANSESANSRGVEDDLEKSSEEKVLVPEVTSGTPEMVVLVVSQVMSPWMAVTVSWTSAGRVVLPTMKHAFACRSKMEIGPKLRISIFDLYARE